ncbi:MAG: glycerol-3-phosphate 1-O-acyltransferase PlsY [Ruminococcus sp.]|nr:glycerol-3-phosphate 1-O-acyltransferase PlsY [Ruminococcus sp.]
MNLGTLILNNWYFILGAVVIAYLLGSINTAVIVTRIVTKGKKDIREMGSGNAGFTNVLRSVGKVPAIFTIVCDALKAIIAVYVGGLLFSFMSVGDLSIENVAKIGMYISGFACIIGHSYPIYFHFKGGKGIVTAAGMMLVLDWRVFLLILGTFLIVFICSKIISLSSLVSAVLFGFYTFILAYFADHGSALYVTFCTVASFGIGLFVIIKHKDNIKRLMKGEEKKITAKKN